MLYCRHSRRKHQYKHLQVIGCQSKERLIFRLMKTKHPIHIRVFKLITSNGDAMPPLIFPYGLTQNTEGYIKSVKEVMLSWIEWVTAGRSYVLKEDTAPSHSSRKKTVLAVRKFLRIRYSKHLAALYPDCNHFDHYASGAVKWEMRKLSATPKINWRQGYPQH